MLELIAEIEKAGFSWLIRTDKQHQYFVHVHISYPNPNLMVGGTFFEISCKAYGPLEGSLKRCFELAQRAKSGLGNCNTCEMFKSEGEIYDLSLVMAP